MTASLAATDDREFAFPCLRPSYTVGMRIHRPAASLCVMGMKAANASNLGPHGYCVTAEERLLPQSESHATRVVAC